MMNDASQSEVASLLHDISTKLSTIQTSRDLVELDLEEAGCLSQLPSACQQRLDAITQQVEELERMKRRITQLLQLPSSQAQPQT